MDCIEYDVFRKFPEVMAVSVARAGDRKGLGSLLFLKQVHGDRIVRAEDGAVGDGMFTEDWGVGLAISHADCQALLMYDPVRSVIAAAHVGWRGNVADLPGKMVERLQTETGCVPSDLRVAISPSLGPECAEFQNYREELPESFWRFQIQPLYFDLWAISVWQLEQRGVLRENIEKAGICSKCNPARWCSYRRDRATDRNVSVIALNAVERRS